MFREMQIFLSFSRGFQEGRVLHHLSDFASLIQSICIHRFRWIVYTQVPKSPVKKKKNSKKVAFKKHLI